MIELKPDAAGAYCSLGDALRYTGQLAEAVECFEKDLELRPDRAETYNLLGNALKEQGRLEEGVAAYRRAMELDPDLRDAAHESSAGFALSARSVVGGVGPAARPVGRSTCRAAAKHVAASCELGEPERRLRLGFLSADLGFHPVGYFLIRTLENLDREQCEVVCYSDRTVIDSLTARFQAAATTWRQVSGRTDEELAEQIRADGIDILFELAGHTYGHRLLVFARKPAPIQISWIGYEGTTGLRAIEFLLADRNIIPPGAESDYPERILRLPDSYVCYEPPSEVPAVGPLLARSNSYVTLGSFNNPAKINAEVIDVWVEILRKLPSARLLLKYHGLDDDRTQQRLRAQFVDRGVSGDRISLRGWSSFSELLAEYNQVDIALDPFPFSGGATSCNALWIGVPLITCPGETFASRHGLSYLSGLGRTETIAGDRQQYVRLAVGLAEDLDRLAALRSQLRQQMSRSPLCDGQRHAANLLEVLRTVWRNYCVSA